MKKGKYTYLDKFVTDFKDEISNKEYNLILDISQDLGFDYIEVSTDGEISIYTIEEPRIENKYGLSGIQDNGKRGLIVRN